MPTATIRSVIGTDQLVKNNRLTRLFSQSPSLGESLSAPALRSIMRKDSGIDLLTHGSEAEALEFLSARPVHSVVMSSFIRDNGLVSDFNRGSFYCYRDHAGRIEGIALVGHATIFETRSDAVLAAFARLVRNSDKVHVIMGEEAGIEQFWRHFTSDGSVPHQVGRELLLEQRDTMLEQACSETVKPGFGLRLATPEDLSVVMTTHARMAFEELGLVNPIVADPKGFPARCARRIDQRRVWVLIENGSLVFKADVVADTPEAIYLEGIYVNPEKRGQGYGLSCLTQLSRSLLKRTRSICLLVNDHNHKAHSFYRRAGFRFKSHYTTILLQQRSTP
ncbi:MAG TPA: GNAT family N-acetyltransferase [Pyrinomonadaceae bacterium]